MQSMFSTKNTSSLTIRKNPMRFVASKALRRLSLGSILCASLLLGACASVGNTTPEAQVTQRANARWQALVGNNTSAAYALTSPSFRSVVDMETYRKRTGSAVLWEAAEAAAVECSQPDLCKAKIRIDVKPLIARGAANKFSTYIDETWVLENGQWWFAESVDLK